jgi:hypothetical protein
LSSLVLSGDTSGAITIAAPAVAGTNTLTLPAQTATVITDSSAALNIGSGQIYKDASGNVGIGTTSPSSYATAGLVVVGTGSAGLGDGQITAYSSSAQAAGYGGQIVFGGQDGVAAIRTFASVLGAKENSTSGNYASYLGFNTRANGGSVSERMRIDSSGQVLVGLSSGYTTAPVQSYQTSAGQWAFGAKSTASAGSTYFITFNTSDNTQRGYIYYNGTSTVYSTSSDERLKKNIEDAPSAISDISAIKIRSFDWKENGQHQKYGVVAQELQIIAPDAISTPPEENGILGVDYSLLVPMMIKAIQEQQTIIETLKTDIAELKAKVNV